MHIGKEEGADLDVLEIAVLLHDIGRKEEMGSRGGFCHAEKGAEIARDILAEYDLGQKEIDNIIHCIITHRFRNSHVPKTIEAKVLFDSDKLDSIGAIGIARAFLFAGNAGSGNLYIGNERKIAKKANVKDHAFSEEDSAILEYEIKLKKVKNKIITNTGKRIAEERHRFMKEYFDRFWKEVKGEL